MCQVPFRKDPMTSIIAFASTEALIQAVIWIVGVGLIAWLLWWLVDYAGLPAPLAKIAKVLIALFLVIFLIRLIIKITGYP